MKKAVSVLLSAAMLINAPAVAFAAETADTVTNNGTEENNPTSIPVSGEYLETAGGDKMISVDVAWETMKFTYNAGNYYLWDPQTHSNSYQTSGTGKWSDNTAAIKVTNHSNTDITANFTFSGKEGIKGNFTKDAFSLDSADDDAYRTSDGSTPPAPSDSTAFGIDAESEAISENGSLGTITVKIDEPFVYDATSASADELKTALAAALADGKANIRITLPSGEDDNNTNMFTAMREAFDESEVPDGSIDLTISGTTIVTNALAGLRYGNGGGVNNRIPAMDKLRSITLPDATTIYTQAFTACTSIVSVSAPKVTRVNHTAFAGCTSLKNLDLPEMTDSDLHAFAKTAVTSVSLPKATIVGSYCFWQDDSLTTLELPSATKICDYFIAECPALTTLKLTAKGAFTNLDDGDDLSEAFKDATTENIDLYLNIDKKDQVTQNDDGTAAWQGYIFKSIRFVD